MKLQVGCRHFTDEDSITELMNNLNGLSIRNIHAAIQKAEKSQQITTMLLEILRNAKKYKEIEIKFCEKDQLAGIKQQQLEQRKKNLNDAAALPKVWSLSDDDDMEDQIDLEEDKHRHQPLTTHEAAMAGPGGPPGERNLLDLDDEMDDIDP